ncbi:MAG: hypothetical protein RSC76_01870 [Oscillospiraceae bacterium]
MNFLQQFLAYESICIQCHNNPDPDTLASAFGLHCYFREHGIASEIVYGGNERIRKHNLKLMIDKCQIPIRHVTELLGIQLLLYGGGG